MLRPITSSPKTLSAVCKVIDATTSLNNEELQSILISGLSQTSDSICEGDLFIALPGEKFHGAQFAKEAKAKGAVAVLTDVTGASMISDLP
ncbi:MAG: UDP-N-acetylmuramyl tripeptide synthase, partial [Actinobacteria bacterium]|nr:UDP-N-acetylmuramyl tripeptide synthase [Actinomycetota bacterium]MUH48982.1 UDP-N-acetylmuramyl tripeptide synthase [Actinomycetota bacterium]